MSASWFSISKNTLIDILRKLETVFDTKADSSHTHTKSDITDFAHDHPLSIEAASTATSAINLDPNAIYKLTAGGKTFIFKTPADNDHYAWADISGKPSSYPPSAHTHTKSDITDFAHTHPLSIAADSGTSALDMAANTVYKLTAGGNTFIFKTPKDTTYSEASSSAYGLVKIGFTTDETNRNYAVQLSSGKMYVNVPWTDHTYSVNNGTLTLKRNGTNVATFTANQSGNSEADFKVAVNDTLTNQNLNNITTPGFYNAGGGNTCTNKPSGVDAFGLEVIHSASGNYYTQIIWSNTSAVPYRRNCNNGTWGSWALDKLTDTTYTFTNKGVTLAWSTTSTIATVGGVDIKVTMPANPNTDHYAWSDITGKPTSFTPASHTHGNIQNGGTLQTNDIAIASGDKLVVTDSSDSSKIARASISFDGSTATKCLTQKGTWESFTNNAGTVTLAAVDDTDATEYRAYFGTTNGAGKYHGTRFQYIPKYGKLVCYNSSNVSCWALYDTNLSNTNRVGSYLELGNSVSTNTGGPRVGVVRLYRNGYYTDVESSTITANRTVEIADQSGYIPVFNTTAAGDDDSGGYYLYISNMATKNGIVQRHRLKYMPSQGKLYCLNSSDKESWALYDTDIDSTSKKYSYLVLGNNGGVSTTGTRQGYLRIYGSGQYYTEVSTVAASRSYTVNFPDNDGYVAVVGATDDTSTTDFYVYFGTEVGRAACHPHRLHYRPSVGNLYCDNSSLVRSWSIWDQDIDSTNLQAVSLELGNKQASGTAGKRYGVLTIDAQDANYVNLTCTSGRLFSGGGEVVTSAGLDSPRCGYIGPSGTDYAFLYCSTTGGSYGINWWASDTKLKENIKDTKVTALDKVDRIDFIQFDWKRDGIKKDDKHVSLGVSANQIEEFMPDAVWNIKQPEDYEYDTIKNIDTGKMTTYALKAIQELHKVVKDQAAEIAELKSKLA